MKSAKALGEEIQALQSKVQAIQAVATQEGRELLEDEQTEIDSILGTEGKAGQIENLSKQRERAIKIEQAVSNTVRQVVDNQPSAVGNFKILGGFCIHCPRSGDLTDAQNDERGADDHHDPQAKSPGGLFHATFPRLG